MTREESIEIAEKKGGKFPSKYLLASLSLIQIWSPQIKTVLGLLQLDNIINLIDSLGLDTNYSKYKFSELKKYIYNDKKVADGKLNLILINEKFKAFKTSQFDQKNIKKAFI